MNPNELAQLLLVIVLLCGAVVVLRDLFGTGVDR